MKKYLIFFTTICTFMIMPASFANQYNDLNNNPAYVYIGGTGTGISIFMDKTSINVHKYEPPIYIIGFTAMQYSSGFAPEGIPESVVPKNYLYYYDYSSRNMYIECYNYNKKPYWKLIDSSPESYNQNSAENLILSGGEIAFYIAYNISFYNEPKTYLTKKYMYKN